MDPRPLITVIGKGNLGHHLVAGLSEHLQVAHLGRGEQPDPASELVLVAVPDAAVMELCDTLPDSLLVAHTAGAIDLPKGKRRGVFYPLYSFTKEAAVNWSEVPLLLEATLEDDLALLERVGRVLTDKIFHLESERREKLHAAAVKVNNFTNHLYTLAFEHAEAYGVPVEVLYPIMRQGPEKAIALGPRHAQTGPAKRGDWETIEKHMGQLTSDEAKSLYKLLSESIAKWHNS